ncbi:MAG TPA: hypothetical protein VEH27_02440 [Methylomirabilota bacterium]|nr:hypothetical protein [Methylomirabilota bacterium]
MPPKGYIKPVKKGPVTTFRPNQEAHRLLMWAHRKTGKPITRLIEECIINAYRLRKDIDANSK